MSNLKNVIMKKKIEGVVYDLLVQTSAEQVTFADTTVKAKIEAIVESITNLTNGKADADAVVTALKASSASGKVTFTKNGTDTDVAVKGVVVDPTYVADTRTLTLPVTKADGTTENVVMALGKDLVVKSGSLDAKKENIVLVLTNDEEIKIPVKSLVDIYTGGTTNSVVVSVDANNEITAQVRVSAKAGNALSVETEEGKEGLYVAQATVDSALSDSSENAVQNKVVKGALDNKVDKVEGKGLSTNDFDDNAQTKLNGIETGAQVNVIESVKVNGQALTPDVNKAVDVTTSRILVSATEPAGLTENDIWFQEIAE